jgi:hypothetical protein
LRPDPIFPDTIIFCIVELVGQVKGVTVFSCDELLIEVDESNLKPMFEAVTVASNSLAPTLAQLFSISSFKLYAIPCGKRMADSINFRSAKFLSRSCPRGCTFGYYPIPEKIPQPTAIPMKNDVIKTPKFVGSAKYENSENLSDSETEGLDAKPEDVFFIRIDPLNPKEWTLKHVPKLKYLAALIDLFDVRGWIRTYDIRSILEYDQVASPDSLK